jgi:hypothetical protein
MNPAGLESRTVGGLLREFTVWIPHPKLLEIVRQSVPVHA